MKISEKRKKWLSKKVILNCFLLAFAIIVIALFFGIAQLVVSPGLPMTERALFLFIVWGILSALIWFVGFTNPDIAKIVFKMLGFEDQDQEEKEPQGVSSPKHEKEEDQSSDFSIHAPMMSEKEMEETLSHTEDRFYNMLKDIWKSSVKRGLALEVGALLLGLAIGFIAKDRGIVINLPQIEFQVPPLTLATVSTAVFQATVTVSGIILGFGAVCVFFMLEWSERRIEHYDMQSRRLRSEQKRNETIYKMTLIDGMSRGLSKYAEMFVIVSIGLILIELTSFFVCIFSGLFMMVSILGDLNVILVIASGLYPMIRFVLLVRPILKDTLTRLKYGTKRGDS